MQNRCHRPIQQPINLGGLSEVSNLSRATVISNRRQQIVLHDGTQGHVWTEADRLAQGPLGKFFCGVFPSASLRSILAACRSRQRLTSRGFVVAEKRKRIF